LHKSVIATGCICSELSRKGKATYYNPGKGLSTEVSDALSTEPHKLDSQVYVYDNEDYMLQVHNLMK